MGRQPDVNKVDKGFELVYAKLSYRRKFIRTLWLIPFAIAAVCGVIILFKSTWAAILLSILFVIIGGIQLIYNYKKWKYFEKDIK
jgi:hypothetical protein